MHTEKSYINLIWQCAYQLIHRHTEFGCVRFGDIQEKWFFGWKHNFSPVRAMREVFFTIWHFCKAFLYISCMEFSMLHRNGIDFVRRNYMSVYWSRNKYQLKCNVCSGNLGSFLLRGLIFDRHILFSFKRLSSNKFKLNALREIDIRKWYQYIEILGSYLLRRATWYYLSLWDQPSTNCV